MEYGVWELRMVMVLKLYLALVFFSFSTVHGFPWARYLTSP